MVRLVAASFVCHNPNGFSTKTHSFSPLISSSARFSQSGSSSPQRIVSNECSMNLSSEVLLEETASFRSRFKLRIRFSPTHQSGCSFNSAWRKIYVRCDVKNQPKSSNDLSVSKLLICVSKYQNLSQILHAENSVSSKDCQGCQQILIVRHL